MDTPMIEIQNLSKSFGSLAAVKNLSFTVAEGSLFAFLGVNGAGKSTTISILCGKYAKDAGEIRINGHDLEKELDQVKGDLGVVFQYSVLDQELSVKDNLEVRAALYQIVGAQFRKRLAELAELLEFSSFLKQPVGKLSGGQRRRIDIARALLHQPKLLILDEPTTGLDPQTRRLLWQVIETLQKEQGLTVLLTTHYMEEAAGADEVVIIDQGEIVAAGTPLSLKNRFTSDYLTLYGVTETAVRQMQREYQPVAEGFRVFVDTPQEATRLIQQHLALFTDYELTKGRMDDVFLAVTGKTLPQETKEGARV